jgi:hypothetical protein
MIGSWIEPGFGRDHRRIFAEQNYGAMVLVCRGPNGSGHRGCRAEARLYETWAAAVSSFSHHVVRAGH